MSTRVPFAVEAMRAGHDVLVQQDEKWRMNIRPRKAVVRDGLPGPERALAFAEEAMRAGWDVIFEHGIDTGENAFVTVRARKAGTMQPELYLTWHTRAAGTYRLFTCLVGHRRVSLAEAREGLHRNGGTS